MPAAKKRKAATQRSLARSPLERLRAICLALPEANERVSHGEPTWFAGKGKVFAMFDNHHHGAKHLAVWLPLFNPKRVDLVSRRVGNYRWSPQLRLMPTLVWVR